MQDKSRIGLTSKSVDRRKFLQSAGTATGITLLGSGVGAAIPAKKRKYVGYTYDPQTRAIYGAASAEITQIDEKLEGVYQFDNILNAGQAKSLFRQRGLFFQDFNCSDSPSCGPARQRQPEG